VIGHDAVLSSARTGRGSDDWQTPAHIWDLVNACARELSVDVHDPCPTGYVEGRDPNGLLGAWPLDRLCYVNPPYSAAKAWAEKCAHARGCRVILLVPARTDTRWFHAVVMTTADAVLFVRGRLTFVGAPAPAPFPSMLVAWGVGQAFARAFGDLGALLAVPSHDAPGLYVGVDGVRAAVRRPAVPR
jgi:site-specific DNA-methyltransferase (adenine-specific)